MRKAALCIAAAVLAPIAGPALAQADARRAQELEKLRFGMFICWSLSTFSGREWTQGVTDPAFFRASGCDTDQWCRIAREAGMGYILFLSKHHDGFCLWDTATTDFKVTNSPLGIDVLAKLRKSCDEHGIELALYFSEGDWTWPGKKGTRSGANPKVKKAQLQELCTRYGPIQFFWMDHAANDGGLSHTETVAWVHRFQPDCFVGFNHGQPAGRLAIRERGRAGPLGGRSLRQYGKEMEKGYKGYLVAEFTYPILPAHKGGAQWFYSLPEHDHLCLPAEKIYRDCLGAAKYGNLFSLDVGPDYEGKLRAIDVKTLRKVGRYLRGEIPPPPQLPPPLALKRATASSIWDENYSAARAADGDLGTRWGAARGSRSGWLQVELEQPARVARAVIVEGAWNRVRRFEVQVEEGGSWKVLAAGATLGERKEIRFAPVRARSFRLVIAEAIEVPTIYEFELHER